jgi:hypothetical protein
MYTKERDYRKEQYYQAHPPPQMMKIIDHKI